MRRVTLHHDGRLGLAPGQNGPVPAGWEPPVAGAAVLAFRDFAGAAPDRAIGGLSGTSRLTDDFGPDVCTYGFEGDTFLAPLLLWDIAHTLPAGGSLTTAGDGPGDGYLSRAYFRDGLRVEARTADATTYRKVAPLPVERDRGLTRWTFGVPTGPGDATGLNAVVKRILELGVPEFEVVLCGRPGPGFRYFDAVRIVGEELSKPPVRIGRKKNLLAEAAGYENLCLLHDRVFLPRDFYAAVTAFGDDYPLACFQSIWFDDPYNLIPKRYSDYARARNGWAEGAFGDPDGRGAFYAQDLFAVEPDGGFVAAHPLRYHRGNFCAGSLYLAKRSLWRALPQSDALTLSEYEDAEHGARASRAGVPSRVNPFAFTQTLFARPSALGPAALFETPDGRAEPSVSPLEAVRFARKPLVRRSGVEARARMREFALKYVPPELLDGVLGELSRPGGGGAADWARRVAVVAYAARVRYGEGAVLAFLADLESHVLGDALSRHAKRFLVECFAQDGTAARAELVERSGLLRDLLFYRPHGNLFYDSLAEYFPSRTRALERGTAWTARRLARHGGLLFALGGPGTAAAYEAALLNSTPFAADCEARP